MQVHSVVLCTLGTVDEGLVCGQAADRAALTSLMWNSLDFATLNRIPPRLR